MATDRIRYRDYLLGVWSAIAARNSGREGAPWLKPPVAEAQLEVRFHQTFTTTDQTSDRANQLRAATVYRYLTDPAQAGLGADPSTVPAQGNLPPREYLDQLIARSGVDAHELGIRLRLRLDQGDDVFSDPVEENIATLLGFLTDSFQSVPDPFKALPDVRSEPIIPREQQGHAPFFLEYEEWLAATARFYPENVLSFTRTLQLDRVSQYLQNIGPTAPEHADTVKVVPIIADMMVVFDLIGQQQLPMALNTIRTTRARATAVVPDQTAFDRVKPMQARRHRAISEKQQLIAFEKFLGGYDLAVPDAYDFSSNPFGAVWMALTLWTAYFSHVLEADILLAQGEYADAVRIYAALNHQDVGIADAEDTAGYPGHYLSDNALYEDGGLPYTLDRAGALSGDPTWQQGIGEEFTLTPRGIRSLLHDVDTRLLALRLGNALLDWADALFRSNEHASIARASELYKAALWVNGQDPGVSPHWPLPAGTGKHKPIKVSVINPAAQSQIARATVGRYRIMNGLNVFGVTEEYVPVQRYRVLEDAADRFAGLAKAAEHDFLTAMGNLEQLSIDRMRNANLATKAQAQIEISQESKAMADRNVQVAQGQMNDVQSQISAKQQEIADHDSFGTQVMDFASGFKDALDGLANIRQAATTGAGAAQVFQPFADEIGTNSVTFDGMFAGAGADLAAAGMATGFAVFVYCGVKSISGMHDAQQARIDSLDKLENQVLPAAQANVVQQQRMAHIAALQQQIAQADADLAASLLQFDALRLLNVEFWASVATVLRRVLDRYLDLGAWAGWQAERALAFEQNRPIQIMRFGYVVRQLSGVTGADLLQSDLAELAAARLYGQRRMVPFRYALSLVEDFPLAYGALRATGRCMFVTLESALRTAYPGTFGHRLTSVVVAVNSPIPGRRARGILTNQGFSTATIDETLRTTSLLRFPDALPVSESGATTTSSPEVLDPFEGLALDTEWGLELRAEDITDVVITLSGLANYSPILPREASQPIDRTLLVSALVHGTAGAIQNLRTAGSGSTIVSPPFPAGESNRVLENVFVAMTGAPDTTIMATVRLGTTQAAFSLVNGLAQSNGDPLRQPGSTTPAAPLNTLIGQRPDQPWTITIEPGVRLDTVTDIVLGIMYRAN